MRKVKLAPFWFRGLLALLALTLVAGLRVVAAPDGAAPASRPGAAGQPNIIFVLTDDLDYYEWTLVPQLQSDLAAQGTSFDNFFVTDSLCCPSRASILRGEYVHNHQTLNNGPPDGGFEKFHAVGNENSTIGTWMHAAGYRTALMGKYLNDYPTSAAPNYVPPGWDEWDAGASNAAYTEYNYKLNENGQLVSYGHQCQDYLVDVLSQKADTFIQANAGKQPLFMYVASYVPHQPATAACRYAGRFNGQPAPRPPSFNATGANEPAWLASHPALTQPEISQIDNLYDRRRAAMLAEQDLVHNLIQTLQATGQLDNTYIFFSSDNGFHLGQHRLNPGKMTAFEEDIHVPLVVRGPGVPAGVTLHHMLQTTDLAPTWAALAGAQVPDFVNGRSFVPLLRPNAPAASTGRQVALIEHYGTVASNGTPAPDDEPTALAALQVPTLPSDPDDDAAWLNLTLPLAPAPAGAKAGLKEQPPTYAALRTMNYTYVEYTTGERELYDLQKDQNELNNIAASADPGLLAALAARLAALRTCTGTGCHAAEDQAIEAPAGGPSRTFPQTGKTVGGRFLAYWDSHGGLAQQGLPISGELQEVNPTDGKTYTVQYFERAVFELHPENQPPFDVLLSLLGNRQYKQKYPNGAPGQHPNTTAGSVAFPQTGHRLGGIFLAYWTAHGGLAQQGYPISDEFQEVSPVDGKTYTVQYFERAVFEYHPENQPPYNVLLSLLGSFYYHAGHPGG